MPTKKEKRQVSKELRDAHSTVLAVSAREIFGSLSSQVQEGLAAVEQGDLKLGYQTLKVAKEACNRMQMQIVHSARQLGVSLEEDEDDEDDDD